MLRLAEASLLLNHIERIKRLGADLSLLLGQTVTDLLQALLFRNDLLYLGDVALRDSRPRRLLYVHLAMEQLLVLLVCFYRRRVLH